MVWKLNKISNKIILLTISILLFSCVERNDGTPTEEELNKFKEKVLINGDKYSYSRLLIHYTNIDKTIDLLPYSMLMGDIYKNPDANRQVYIDMIKLYNKGNYSDSLFLNLKHKEFIINYLKKSADLGDEKAVEILKSIK